MGHSGRQRASGGEDVHPSHLCPIVEFPNNAEYKGDAECVFDLIALYNEVLNNRCKNLYDVVNYILFLKNVRLGDEEETRKVVELLKRHHILPSMGVPADLVPPKKDSAGTPFFTGAGLSTACGAALMLLVNHRRGRL